MTKMTYRALQGIMLLTCSTIGFVTYAQNLVSGPMLGYAEHREVSIWVEPKAGSKTVAVSYWAEKVGKKKAEVVTMTLNPKVAFLPTTFKLGPLEMGAKYRYQILVDKKVQKNATGADEFSFSTKMLWEYRTPAPDFNFIVGSCTYVNDSLYDRPGKGYGTSLQIYEVMAKENAAFNLWLGDNWYYREADFSSTSGLAYRASHDRAAIPASFLSARPNIAIWDDHDFGPNDSHRGYPFANTTDSLFKAYWPNLNYPAKGTYGYFQYSDCDFFLLDDRRFRMPNNDKHTPDSEKVYFGKEQMDFLKDNLLNSRATFKFIVNGNQFLNPGVEVGEAVTFYKKDYEEIMEFIKVNKIRGVVFLSGDRHFTEMIKVSPAGMYTMYDYTSSPISSGSYKQANMKPGELNNPNRVAGSMYNEANYGRIAVSGAKGERKVTIQTMDAQGKEAWKFEISEKDLKF